MRALEFDQVLALLGRRSEVPDDLLPELDREVEAWVDHLAGEVIRMHGEKRLGELRASLRDADSDAERADLLRQMHAISKRVRHG